MARFTEDGEGGVRIAAESLLQTVMMIEPTLLLRTVLFAQPYKCSALIRMDYYDIKKFGKVWPDLERFVLGGAHQESSWKNHTCRVFRSEVKWKMKVMADR